MARFDAVRPQQIDTLLLFDQFAHRSQERAVEKNAIQSSTRRNLVEQASVATIEAAHYLRGLRSRRGLAKILFEPVGQLTVPFGTLFRCHGLHRGTKGPLIALAPSAHEVYKEICSGHD